MDTFSYKFRESVPETGLEKEISFQVKEKRIVSCNPSLGNRKSVFDTSTPLPLNLEGWGFLFSSFAS